MATADLLADSLDRIAQTVHEAVDGLDEQQLSVRLDPDANSVAWLVWHLARVQDDHLAAAAGSAQVWTTDGWSQRFRLPFADKAIGYGHSSDEVASVRAPAELLTGYHDAVHARSSAWVHTLDDEALARVVDESWGEPVTLAVRLVSVIDDCTQHAGQAAFVRGVVERTVSPARSPRE